MASSKNYSKTITIDFPDGWVANVLTERWHETAKILNLDFEYESSQFGYEQYHFTLTVTGSKTNVERFCKFVEESSELGNELVH